jgi:hypothetical protein
MREHDDRHVAFVAQGCQAFQQDLPRIGGCLVATLECGVLGAVIDALPAVIDPALIILNER